MLAEVLADAEDDALADDEAFALALTFADTLADEEVDADSLALADCSAAVASLAASVALDEHPARTSAETLAAPATDNVNLILRDPDADPIIDIPFTTVRSYPRCALITM